MNPDDINSDLYDVMVDARAENGMWRCHCIVGAMDLPYETAYMMRNRFRELIKQGKLVAKTKVPIEHSIFLEPSAYRLTPALTIELVLNND